MCLERYVARCILRIP